MKKSTKWLEKNIFDYINQKESSLFKKLLRKLLFLFYGLFFNRKATFINFFLIDKKTKIYPLDSFSDKELESIHTILKEDLSFLNRIICKKILLHINFLHSPFFKPNDVEFIFQKCIWYLNKDDIEELILKIKEDFSMAKMCDMAIFLESVEILIYLYRITFNPKSLEECADYLRESSDATAEFDYRHIVMNLYFEAGTRTAFEKLEQLKSEFGNLGDCGDEGEYLAFATYCSFFETSSDTFTPIVDEIHQEKIKNYPF